MPTVAIYGGAAALLGIATHVAIPRVIASTRMEPVLAWFLFGGLAVFVPLAMSAVVLLRREDWPLLGTAANATVRDRLRFRGFNRREMVETLAAFLVMLAASGASLAAARALLGEVRLGPSFLHFEPLSGPRLWILAAWLPFFLLNILSEEVLWHAVVLPRQEVSFGKAAWAVAGAAWLLFHIPFGRDILLIVWPTTFLTPWIVQRTKNSWSGVVLHAGINGPGFLAAAFGWV